MDVLDSFFTNSVSHDFDPFSNDLFRFHHVILDINNADPQANPIIDFRKNRQVI